MGVETKWSKDGLDATVTCDCKVCKKGEDECSAYKRAETLARKEEQKRGRAEESRQKALAAKPRSAAKVPEAAKLHATLSARKIEAWFGPYGLPVLSAVVKKYDDNDEDKEIASYGPFIKRLSMAEQRGKPKIYEVVEALPTVQKFNELRDLHYLTTIEDVISDANEEIESLAGEIREWYDNMPEGFQNASKGEEVNECADQLEGITTVDIDDAPEKIKAMKIVYLPLRDISSRGDRLASATSRYDAAKDRLEEFKGGEEEVKDAGYLAEECSRVVSECDGISFPGMY